MPEVSKKRKTVVLRLDLDKWLQIKAAAASVQEPMTIWIRRAVFAALRKWEVPKVNETLIEPCSICGKRHDRNDHFRD